jgi:hypothetical protein
MRREQEQDATPAALNQEEEATPAALNQEEDATPAALNQEDALNQDSAELSHTCLSFSVMECLIDR